MHVPVMLQETVDSLDVHPGGVYLDATLGGAGHAAEILRRAGAEGRLLGIDHDRAALERARKVLDGVPGTAVCAHGNHRDLGAIADAHGFSALDGVLFDTGVSSDQLDNPASGFSFLRDGPLDMRMDAEGGGETAAALVARLTADELAEIFRRLGEEPQAGRFARAIVRARDRSPITTTGQLADTVARSAGGTAGRRRHPATRIFQALRMAVNGELEALESGLAAALERLRPGGCLAVITFESLSDRLVKRFLAGHVGREVSLEQGGSRWEGTLPAMSLIHRGALRPGADELASNPRARSARLRAARRLAADAPEGLRRNRTRNCVRSGHEHSGQCAAQSDERQTPILKCGSPTGSGGEKTT